MIKLTVNFESMYLGTTVKVDIALPYPCLNDDKLKSLWTLHCAFKDGSFFFDSLGVAKYVDKYKIAIISPSISLPIVGVSNPVFIDFLRNELKPWCEHSFDLSPSSEDNSLFGISMGATAALKTVLDSTMYFKNVALVSGLYDLTLYDFLQLKKQRAQYQLYKLVEKRVLKSIGSMENQLSLIKFIENMPSDIQSVVEKTNFDIYYGKQDFLSNLQSETLFKTLTSVTPDTTSIHSDDGVHETDYWVKALEHFVSKVYGK